MANQTFTLPVALRGSQVFTFNVPARAQWDKLNIQITGTDLITTDGLSIGYTGRVSTDGGVTWTDWGGFTATSPIWIDLHHTIRGNPGGEWPWSGLTSILELTVTCSVPFNWGATATFIDDPNIP